MVNKKLVMRISFIFISMCVATALWLKIEGYDPWDVLAPALSMMVVIGWILFVIGLNEISGNAMEEDWPEEGCQYCGSPFCAESCNEKVSN